jgi:hypothetical protein
MHLSKGQLGEVGEDERSLVDLGVVVAVALVLLVLGEGTKGLRDVTVGVLGADHESNLSGGVGRDGSVGVLDGGEDLTARLLELSDELKVKPLVLGCCY